MSDRQLAELVKVALSQDRLVGLKAILEVLARSLSASGCILWEPGPETLVKAAFRRDSLCVLAEWFEDGRMANLHDLSFARSVSGLAVIRREPEWIDDAQTDPRVDQHRSYLTSAGIQSICALPVEFDGNSHGALSLSRNSGGRFSDEEKKRLEGVSGLIPDLHEAIRNRISLHFVRESSLLLQHDLKTTEPAAAEREAGRILEKLADLIAQTFNCLEASIYLRDPGLYPDRVRLFATTWRRPDQDIEIELRKNASLTAWAARHKKPLRIFDLRDVEPQSEIVRRRYRGLRWSNYEAVRRMVGAHPQMTAYREQLPPLSFIAVPILSGRDLLGVVRCFAAIEAPFYFARREQSLLEILAAQIGNLWGSWIRHRETEIENRSWQNLIQGIAELNAFTQKKLSARALQQDTGPILRKTLEVSRSAVAGADILDVRLLDEAKTHLRFAATLGEAWDRGDATGIQARLERGFPLGPRAPLSAGAHVVDTGELYRVTDVKKEEFYAETFPETREVLVAPIRDGQEIVGVLDIRTTSEAGFPKHADQVAQLMAQQLGLYLSVAHAAQELEKKADELRKSLRQLKSLQDAQKQAYEDLFHQLKSPVFQAYRRLQRLVSGEVPLEGRERQLRAARGLCRKAQRVVNSLGLFAELARNQLLRTKTAPLHSSYLRMMLIEAAEDAELLSQKPSGRVFVDVDAASFDKVDSIRVMADRALLEQAINNLLDNASKYSFPGTRVTISGKITKRDHFAISVVNTGIRIRGSEVSRATLRGWRGDQAKEVTSEGAGIGLWLVYHIMEAHHGVLSIEPTAKDDRTEIALIFPIVPQVRAA